MHSTSSYHHKLFSPLPPGAAQNRSPQDGCIKTRPQPVSSQGEDSSRTFEKESQPQTPPPNLQNSKMIRHSAQKPYPPASHVVQE
ncbi:hypothetical protein SKAU_G00088700 [Synaphobranchus kaupii]|uniref:Uncharacterized protein n=1 Tax=Synaphobranchus kaupii TaxID=118154 RepID=A0A9Q1FWP1_SYNKA|nr:hypothetical protein SKAU_G00088700 [Synaphobranchus kaupii]